jgi:hydroxymethylbilane synthase
VDDLRGNVGTRLRRLREGVFDAILLAMAGLVRLGRADEVTEPLDPRRFVPAPGQGAIALECRADDLSVREAVAFLDHPSTARRVGAERAFLAALGGGCNVPLGAHAFEDGPDLELIGLVARADGSQVLRDVSRGAGPRDVGTALAEKLLGRGARRLLAP